MVDNQGILDFNSLNLRREPLFDPFDCLSLRLLFINFISMVAIEEGIHMLLQLDERLVD